MILKKEEKKVNLSGLIPEYGSTVSFTDFRIFGLRIYRRTATYGKSDKRYVTTSSKIFGIPVFTKITHVD
jgi:hypothetical protein